ncbi:MAG: hypothetical protein IJT82_02025, partial [Schwartzia sp.]|nr:hypothetical protein [Schwartzia sp. (in: firmicutes)]
NSGELGEGVSISRIAISIDSDGNMKLFAELERASAERQERMEAAKDKKAEEAAKKEKADKAKEEEKEKPKSLLQRTRIEASSEEELLEKIRGLNWDEIPWGKEKKDDTIDKAIR